MNFLTKEEIENLESDKKRLFGNLERLYLAYRVNMFEHPDSQSIESILKCSPGLAINYLMYFRDKGWFDLFSTGISAISSEGFQALNDYKEGGYAE
jgi:hypothetical protein